MRFKCAATSRSPESRQRIDDLEKRYFCRSAAPAAATFAAIRLASALIAVRRGDYVGIGGSAEMRDSRLS
jgi:hypothetical protein